MGGEKKGNLRREALTVQKGFGIIQKSSKQEFIGRDTEFHGKREAAADSRGFCTVIGNMSQAGFFFHVIGTSLYIERSGFKL